MKLALINPGLGSYDDNLNATGSTPPLGALYIAANLIKNSNEVSFIDQPAKKLSDKELINKIKKQNPDYVLFSVMVTETNHSGGLSAKIKEVIPEARIVWGGPQPTFCSKEIMTNYPVDFCIRGPGEESIVSLINGDDHNNIPGLVYKENGLVKNANQQLGIIKHLDDLPFPARELIIKDVDLYGGISGFRLEKCGSLISSRGCPYACTYCACNALTERKVHYRSIDNVIKELELMASQGYKNIIFFDDSLTLNEKRTIDLSDEIKKSKLGIDWIFEGRVNDKSSKKEMFKAMARSGCKMAYFGIESGVQRVLDYYKKGITPQMAVKAISNAKEAGIDFINNSFIIGAPGETEEEINQTIKFIKRLAENYVDFFQITKLMVYPGTILWNEMVNNGYLNPADYWENGVEAVSVWHNKHPESISPGSLSDKLTQAYESYLYDKRYWAKHIYRATTSKWRAKQAVNNIPYIAFGKGTLLTKLTGLPKDDDYENIREMINRTPVTKLIRKLGKKICS